jgi:hypothetical protein
VIYVDPTTSLRAAAAAVVDDSADRYARRAPLTIGDRWRVDAGTVGTVASIARDAGGRLVAVTVETGDGTRYRMERPDAFRPPVTLADSIDAVRKVTP